MSSISIPMPMHRLLTAVEARDLDGVQAAFSPEAEIHDEGEVVRGPAGVAHWATRLFGYQPTIAVQGVDEDGDAAVVTTSVAGKFPGSPITFQWHLTFADGKISTLRIEL